HGGPARGRKVPRQRYRETFSAPRRSDVASGGVAGRQITALVASGEPLLALLGRPMRERIGRHAALRLLLNPIVANCRRRIERLRNVGGTGLLEIARLHGMVGPHAGETVRLELCPPARGLSPGSLYARCVPSARKEE